MKKILLFSAILVGTVAASQAAVHVDIGINLPFPRPERVIISRPAPVYVERAPACAPPVVVMQAPPVYRVPAPVIVVPRGGYYYPRGPVHYGQYRYDHRAWNHHSHRSHGSHGHRR